MLKKLTEALKELSARTQLAIPLPDDAGNTAFAVIHDGVQIDLYIHALVDNNLVSILCPVGKIPATVAKPFIGRPLLIANLLGSQTNGLSLALNPVDDSVVLGYSIFGKSLTPDLIEEVIGRFVVAGRVWKEQLARQFPG